VNLRRAEQILTALAHAGVGELCVCPGGRNSPLVVAAEAGSGIRAYTFFEERSAGFFSLGRARATGAPVAVITTSGTAAAELLPAAIEGHYSGTPLVLVTGDRPSAYRGTGSPQAIEQRDLFGCYARTVFDGENPDDALDLSEWDAAGPIHVNVRFDEPLVDGEPTARGYDVRPRAKARRLVNAAPLLDFLRRSSRPLVVLGPLEREDHVGVCSFLSRLGAPVYAEPASGLREDPRIADLVLTSGERILRRAEYDAVLRLGGVPTLRLWRDLETTRRDVPVCSVAGVPFRGITRSVLLHAAVGECLGDLDVPSPGAECAEFRARLLERDRARHDALVGLLDEEPLAEPAMVRALSGIVPDASLVYLGNSLPIREWDLAAERVPRDWTVGVNRGANGIDGQLSTFFGSCTPGREHWALLGDLTVLYDLSAPWALSQLESGPIRVVVVNNGGGQIFSRLYRRPIFLNRHELRFGGWAHMWGLEYRHVSSGPSDGRWPQRVVIEMAPDAAATKRFWAAYDLMDDQP